MFHFNMGAPLCYWIPAIPDQYSIQFITLHLFAVSGTKVNNNLPNVKFFFALAITAGL